MEQVSNRQSATVFNELASRSWNNGNFTPVLPFEFTESLFEKLSAQVKEHGYLVGVALESDLPTLKEEIGRISGKEVEEVEDIVCLLESAFLAAQEALERSRKADRLIYEERIDRSITRALESKR